MGAGKVAGIGQACRCQKAIKKQHSGKECVNGNGGPGRIRTCDLLIRSQTLYPTELRSH